MDAAPNTPSSKIQYGQISLESSKSQSLHFGGTYVCPACRHGQIHQLTLMDAYACDFCRHIFEINLTQQTIQVVDSTQPLLWHWNGSKWKSRHNLDENLTIFLWMVSAFLILVPASIIGLSAYVFPPLPNTQWLWLPFAWAFSTFLAHFLMVSWLMAEHYQFPYYVLSKLRIQRWLNR